MVSPFLLEVEMKKAIIRMLVLLLLVGTFISCETLSDDKTKLPIASNSDFNSPKQLESFVTKFIGTWVYSDKNFSRTASILGEEDWPTDLKVEIAFSFRSDATGTFSVKYTSNDIQHEEQQEFIWSCDSLFPSWVLVVMRDNTADSYNLYYENALFLSMDDKDLGKVYFPKLQ